MPQKAVIPLAHCPSCGVETILYGDWDAGRGCLVRRCTVCERVVDPSEGAEIDYLAACDFEGTQFEVTAALPVDGGCGGGCSTGGCATCDQVETCEKVH